MMQYSKWPEFWSKFNSAAFAAEDYGGNDLTPASADGFLADVVDFVGGFTTEHHIREVDVNLDWTGLKEDTDFWIWFWIWYTEMDQTWTFDHEPGSVVHDPEFGWEFLHQHTADGHSIDRFEEILIDTDDSEQFSWERWDKFWRDMNAVDLSKEGYFRNHKQELEKMEVNEDDVCGAGFYKTESNDCLPCAVGCSHCHDID